MSIKNALHLYNTLSKKIEDFKSIEKGKVKLYACGPTVYDYTHIGHIRKYVMDDVLVRLLRYLDYQVTHVMNITDVGHLVSDADTGEDKLEKGAKREGKTAWEVAKFYEEYFFKTMGQVNIKRPDIVCRATEHIKEQIALVQKLEAKGFTYIIEDGVYFDSSKFANYGKLAGIDPDKQMAGARVEVVKGKKHPTDFALWKLTPLGEKRHMEWDSPWGKGFPGWHIECSAMSMKYLGESLDIHTGGIDHIPIHHTNEIAQSEASTGKKFVNFWMHHNFVLVNSEKMSKSLKNFFTIDDVKQKGFNPFALRLLFLQTHYRKESNFTWESLTAAQKALSQLQEQFMLLKQQSEKHERLSLSEEKLEKVNLLRNKFINAMCDDLNTSQSLATIWEIVKSNIPASDKYDAMLISDEILGLGLGQVQMPNDKLQMSNEVKMLIDKREELRREKKFAEADKIRKEIEESGYIIEDTPTGISVKKNAKFQLSSRIQSELDERSREFSVKRSGFFSLDFARDRNDKYSNSGLIILFGSGEMSPTGRRIHEIVLQKANLINQVKIGILETPTGFETNAKSGWPERMEKFLTAGLKNFQPQITRIRALRKDGDHSTNDKELANLIKHQDYLYAGAGSPSYALTHLKDSLIYQALINAWKNGTVLCLGSAVTVAMSHFSIPVYEIFKVGHDLHWLSGLNFFSQFGLSLTIVPHWNNQEGEDFDTTRCWMGVDRFNKLLKMLPQDEVILGIDEQTAVLIDPGNLQADVLGIGTVTIIKNGKEKVIKKGEKIWLKQLF